MIVHTELFDMSGSRLRKVGSSRHFLVLRLRPPSGSPFKRIYNGFQSECPTGSNSGDRSIHLNQLDSQFDAIWPAAIFVV